MRTQSQPAQIPPNPDIGLAHSSQCQGITTSRTTNVLDYGLLPDVLRFGTAVGRSFAEGRMGERFVVLVGFGFDGRLRSKYGHCIVGNGR